MVLAAAIFATTPAWAQQAAPAAPVPGSNPIVRDKFTADPAPLVVGDRLYLYVGHDEAQRDEMFNMREWLAYSTTDMRHWTDHGAIMKVADFKWAKQDA
jgi:arabinoxylan arabinofuranohydrolase